MSSNLFVEKYNTVQSLADKVKITISTNNVTALLVKNIEFVMISPFNTIKALSANCRGLQGVKKDLKF